MPEAPATTTPAPATYAAAATASVGAITRSQHRQNVERDAIEDGDAGTHEAKQKEKSKEEPFKGTTEKKWEDTYSKCQESQRK